MQIGHRLRAHWGTGPGANLTAQTQLALEARPCLGLLWGQCHDWPSKNKDDRTWGRPYPHLLPPQQEHGQQSRSSLTTLTLNPLGTGGILIVH